MAPDGSGNPQGLRASVSQTDLATALSSDESPQRSDRAGHRQSGIRKSVVIDEKQSSERSYNVESAKNRGSLHGRSSIADPQQASNPKGVEPQAPVRRSSQSQRRSTASRGSLPSAARRSVVDEEPKSPRHHRGSLPSQARVSVSPTPIPNLADPVIKKSRSRSSLRSSTLSAAEVVADESEEEDVEGVPIRKPFDRPPANDEETAQNTGAQATSQSGNHIAALLQQIEFFKGFNVQLIQQIAVEFEERVVCKGELVYREGERQSWMGFVESGTLGVQISEIVAGNGPLRIAEVKVGGHFGERCALGISELRNATLVAEEDCRLLCIEGKALWSAAEAYPSEHYKLILVRDRLKAFLTSRLANSCHPEVAYQLRQASKLQTMLAGEMVLLGTNDKAEKGEKTDEKTKHHEATCVVESGRLFLLGDRREQHGPGAVINENAMLGVRGSATVQASDMPCHVAYISREAFWPLINLVVRERDIFTKLALERLPPSTVDICSCPILTYLQGSAGFWRVVQNLVNQRVIPPGSVICSAEEVSDALHFFQQGSGDAFLCGHRVGQVVTGSYCGELNFLGIANRCAVTVRASDFCVLQTLHRSEVEPHLQRHHTVRARFRELSKLRPHYKRDSAVEIQIRHMQEISFFGNVSDAFLHEIHERLEDRVFLPQQTIMNESAQTEFMCILLAGEADQTNPEGQVIKLRPGDIVGEMGLLCVSMECRETVVATAVCCVQVLYRTLLIETLHRNPQEKRHFEVVAKSCMVKNAHVGTEGEHHSNIYMLPFFKNCGSRFLYLLDLHLERHIFFSDEIIVKEGTEGEEMYILYSGSADVEVNATKVGTLCGGQCFGEMAVLGLAKKRTASIIARTLCDVRILSSKSLEAAIKEFPEERARFESLAATRNRISMETKTGGKVKQTSMFFKDCAPAFAARISELMEDQLYMEGQVLMREGDRGDCMYLIHQGRAAVTVNAEQVAELGDNDIVGEMAVLGISPTRTATVTAKEVCFVQVLYKSQLLPVLRQFPSERQKIRLKAAQRLECRYMSDSVRNLEIFRTAPKAFIEFLDKHTERRVFFNEDVIVREGMHTRTFFMIFSGRASVEIGGEIIAELGSGDVVGELCALNVGEFRSATVNCREICDVYTLKRKFLLEAMEKWPDQHARLKHVAAKRMRENVERKAKETFLLNCPLFEQCSNKFLQCISMHLEDKLYMPGENLCIEGERGDTMFILVTGTLDCVVGEKKVSELYQGSIIGEIAVLGLSSVRTATLRAKTVCLVQMLHRPIFMKYLSEFPREMIQFQEVGAARLEKTPVSGDANIFRTQLLFSKCNSAFLDELSNKLHRKFFFAGQKVIKEGSESNEMYAIQQGHAVVERRGVGIGEIEAGFSFGEMAVMGIASAQTVTVRAETLCDMQVLVRWDLEELLVENKVERKRLLRVIASMMREDLAEVTNMEILTEIPLLHQAEAKLLQSLDQSAEVELARKDELILANDEEIMFVLLQGTARIEVGGIPVRTLSEGDSFGSISVLGLQENRNVQVRASNVCLWLSFTRQSFMNALEECGAKGKKVLQTLTKKLHCETDARQKTLMECAVIQHLELKQEQLSQLIGECEDAVFLPEELIVAHQDRSEVLLFVLSGKAQLGSDMEAVILHSGSSIGDISIEAPHRHAERQHSAQFGSQSVQAIAPCKVMMLHRSSFFSVFETWSTEEQKRVMKKLETLPRQNRGPVRNATLSGASLRQRTDWLAAQYTNSVKMSLKAGKKCFGANQSRKSNHVWGTNKMMNMFVRGFTQAKQEKSSITAEDSHNIDSLVAASGLHKTGTQLALEDQERSLCQDLRRLTLLARHAAGEAHKDHARLRKQAELLKARFQDDSSDSDGEASSKQVDADSGVEVLHRLQIANGKDVFRPREDGKAAPCSAAINALDAEVETLKQQNATAERRIVQLRSKLEKAYDHRDLLLQQLKQTAALA